MYVEYSSNNSGGSWWLEDDDWSALEKAGWVIQWVWLSNLYDENGGYVRGEFGLPKLVPHEESNAKYAGLTGFGGAKKPGDRWLGTLAKYAYKPNCSSLREAVEEWEKVTGEEFNRRWMPMLRPASQLLPLRRCGGRHRQRPGDQLRVQLVTERMPAEEVRAARDAVGGTKQLADLIGLKVRAVRYLMARGAKPSTAELIRLKTRQRAGKTSQRETPTEGK